MGKFLVEGETFLPFQRSLAVTLGLNESIMLQQIHFLIESNKRAGRNFQDGRYWTYNTYNQWYEMYPFFGSITTVKRVILSLENKGVLLTGSYNKMSRDRKKWYTIDYEKLSKLTEIEQKYETNLTSPLAVVLNETKSLKQNGFFESEVKQKKEPTKDVTILKFMDTYMNQFYRKVYKREHPRLKKEQNERVYQTLYEYAKDIWLGDDPTVYDDFCYECLCEMAIAFFNNVHGSDHNINHFATLKILENRFFEAGLL